MFHFNKKQLLWTKKLISIWVLLLQLDVSQAFGEKPSRYEHYIVLSTPVRTPGIYEFSYMGLINDGEIESYNSENRIKIPEQDWMRENVTGDYWKSGTDTLRNEEEWMRNEFNKMMTAMHHSQSDPDIHVLQRRRGCEVERLSDGSVKFLSGSEHYRYDGQDFLSFNLHTEQWEALNDQALSIKQRWNSNTPLIHETLSYIKRTCVDRAEELMKYGDDYIRNYSPPDVYLFSKKASTPDKLNLTCFATGFLPEEVTMKIERNRFQMREKLESTGVRPNGDGSHQLRMSVEIPESDRAEHYCFVMHRALETPIVKIWDGKHQNIQDSSINLVITAVLLMVLTVVVVVGIWMCLKKQKSDSSQGEDTQPKPQNGGKPTSTVTYTANGPNGDRSVAICVYGEDSMSTLLGVEGERRDSTQVEEEPYTDATDPDPQSKDGSNVGSEAEDNENKGTKKRTGLSLNVPNKGISSVKTEDKPKYPLIYETLKYIKKTCVNWAKKLMRYEDDYIRRHYKPIVKTWEKSDSSQGEDTQPKPQNGGKPTSTVTYTANGPNGDRSVAICVYEEDGTIELDSDETNPMLHSGCKSPPLMMHPQGLLQVYTVSEI